MTEATISRVLREWGLDTGAVDVAPVSNPGLSGTPVWRIATGDGLFALRRLTNDLDRAKRATQTHRLMRYAARVLDYVPWPRSTEEGQTVAFHEGHFWSLETWMPGEPTDAPDRPQVEVAATAVWMLHEVTHDSQCFGPFDDEGPSQAIRRRLDTLQAWRPATGQTLIGPTADRAGQVAARLTEALPRVLALVNQVAQTPTRQQPIVGDVRREHVLFTRGRVTGLVDYGAAMLDSPLVDLTRMLGEMAGNDESLWRAGLEAYQMRRPLTDAERQLIVALDVGGVAGACCRWLDWLAEGAVVSSNRVAERLTQLLSRLAAISEGNLVAQRALAGESA